VAQVLPVDVKGADVSKRTMDNGDVIEEYRVSGQLRMVKVTHRAVPVLHVRQERRRPFGQRQGRRVAGVLEAVQLVM
jgi:hypothetical protein